MEFVILVVFLALDFLVLWSLLNGAPFVPTKMSAVERMVRLAKVVPGEKAADLGSGDGRIVIALARAGAEAHGFELNPILVWWSRRKIRRSGLGGKAFIHQANLWKNDFSDFRILTLFGVGHIMAKLESKLQTELVPGARVVSLAFHFPSWPVAEKDQEVFLFRK